jgi:putative acetyltransferase
MAAAAAGSEDELQEEGGLSTLVREEQPEDAAAIRAAVTAAFGQRAEADLVDRLRADGDSVISLVTVEDCRIVGHVLFSKMSAPFRALALAPVSVVPERQNAGIGSRLIRAGLERAATDGWQGVFVLGEPEYYGRFGFDPSHAADFTSPYAGPYFMALTVVGALPATEGKLDHAPAFADLR